MRGVWFVACGVVLFAAACGNNNNKSNNPGQQQSTAAFARTDLVADTAGNAQTTDPHLVNAWGLDQGPSTYFWVANNGTGTSTLYDGDGAPQSLVVTLPAPGGGAAAPTGLVYNGTGDFMMSAGAVSTSALFIFVTEDGTILGWSPQASPTSAIIVADHASDGAVYKGATIGQLDGRNLLYVANFFAGTVDVFDDSFQPATGLATNAFVDTSLPAGYAPFNVFYSGGIVYVTFAQQDDDKKDEVDGAGIGRLVAFGPDGTVMLHFDLGDHANAPWGMTISPGSFGSVGGALLVGNFGDGHVYAVDSGTGAFMTDLVDASGASIVVDGLWGLRFGNDGNAGSTNTLYFTAGPDDEAHGLFGRIDAITM